MDERHRQSGKRGPSPGLASSLALVVGLLVASDAIAEPPAIGARDGLELVSAAARAWSADAALVYVENDEELVPPGRSQRWGYLFFSPSLGRSRAWSVRDRRISQAENLDMKFEAPPLAPHWLDSEAAVAAAEKAGGEKFRTEHHGRLVSMLLMRGAFSEGDPDATTWTLIYGAPGEPSLFVVVDAESGKVQRTWRG